MSLHNLANEIQKKGRGDDRMLVHMTPKEVEGLQAIAKAHGGSLTINPDTGLVEAGFLKNLMPMIIGAGLTAATGGAAAPWMVGLGYGAFETARTGDVGKGLMAGLGAYGGAGLASGIAGAGASSIAEAGGQGAVNQLGSQATTLSADQLTNLSPEQLQGLQSASSSGAYNTADVLKTANAANTQAGAQNLIGAQNFPNLNASQLQAYNDTLASGAYNPADVVRTAGAQNATAGATGMQTASAGLKAGPTAIYNAMPTGSAVSLAAPVVAGALEPKPIDTNQEDYKRKYPELTLAENFRGYTPQRPNPYYTPRGLGYSGYAAGGSVAPQLNNMPAGGLAALQGMRDGYGADQTFDGNIPQFNEGKMVKKPRKATRTSAAQLAGMDPMEAGLAELNNARAMAQMSGNVELPKRSVEELGVINAAQGRYLKGPGDGMSDSIAATINNKQPARLADGEFVIPADVVSHLGNGSSDAGAKKLYKMMDKVRVARTGKKQQAPAVKTDKFMLA
jgi:hypothetical protein